MRRYDPNDDFSLDSSDSMANRMYGVTAREDYRHLIGVDISNPRDMYWIHKETGANVLIDNIGLNNIVALAYDVELNRMYLAVSGTGNPNFYYIDFNPGEDAYLEFVNNLYSVGPRFESLIAVGKNGMKDINPKAVIVGGKVNISEIVDFSNNRFLHRLGHEDQYILLCGVTDTQVVVRQVPLWDQLLTLYAVGGQRAIADLDAPPTYLLNSRLVTWPFIGFPNYLDFYDPAPAAPQPYPNLSNIKLIDESGTTVATWTDEADLWNSLVSLRLPDAGTSIPVLDVRSLLSAGDSFYVIEADVLVDATTLLDYTVRETFPINVDGEPLMWERPDLDVIEEMPQFVFNQWGIMSITTPAVWNGSGFIFTGDKLGLVTLAQAPGTTVDYNLSTVMSRQADYVQVQWTNGGNVVVVTVPSTVQKLQLEGSNTIDAFFDGNTIMFPPNSLAEVQASGGQKDVTLVGDVGTITLYNVAESVVYRLGLFGKGSQLFASPATAHVDLHFDGTTDKSAVRIANTFYAFKELQQPNTTMAIANRGGPSSGGLASAAYQFSMPRMKFIAATNEVEFENDGSFTSYNMAKVVIRNPSTFRKRTINGALLLGTAYQLGDAGRELAIDDYVIVAAAHFNGQVTYVGYKLTADYSSPLKLSPEGYL